jgi:signal transduction histidine kinase
VTAAGAAADGDRLSFAIVSGSTLTIFALGVAAQSAYVYSLTRIGEIHSEGAETFWPRVIANLTCVALVVTVAWLTPLNRHRPLRLASLLTVGVLGGALARSVVQFAVGLYTTLTWSAAILDFVFAAFFISLSYFTGLFVGGVLRRSRRHELSAVTQAARAAAALTALQAEELRIRRDVAEGLHGTVQQRLVLAESRLRNAADRLGRTSGGMVGLDAELLELLAVADELDEVREVDVREMSQLLYPAGVELGIAQSARMMMRRVPSSIAARVVINDSALLWVGGIGERLVVLRVLEEAISNALRHGHASSLSLELSVEADGTLLLVFDDNGNGLSTPVPRLSGLAMLSERLSVAGGSIALTPGPLGGARLVAMMPTA